MNPNFVYPLKDASQFQCAIAKDINDPMFDAVPRICNMSDGSLRLLGTGVQYAGGMAYASLGWPQGCTYGFAGLDYECFLSAADAQFLQVMETDLKAVLNPWSSGVLIPNVANWSVQKNLAAGGMWQIDDVNGDWVDTGFNPGPLSVDTWIPVSLRFSVDWSNLKSSVLSIKENGKIGMIPPALQNVSLLPSNWSTALNTQLQICLSKAGGVALQYRNVVVTLNSSPPA